MTYGTRDVGERDTQRLRRCVKGVKGIYGVRGVETGIRGIRMILSYQETVENNLYLYPLSNPVF
jgi:hypothetical protein